MEDIEQIRKMMKDKLYEKFVVERHPSIYRNYILKVKPFIIDANPRIKRLTDWLDDYIGAPSCEDTFSSNSETEYTFRKIWRNELIRRYGEGVEEFLKKDKLRTNLTTGLHSVILTLGSLLGEDMPRLRKNIRGVVKVIGEMGTGFWVYKEMGIKKRMRIIDDIEDSTYEVAYELSED